MSSGDYGVNVNTFAKHAHLTSEGFSMFPVVYWAKVSEPADFTRAVSNYALFF